MQIYRRPDEIAGYNPRRESAGKELSRELTWSVVLGGLTGAALLTAGMPPRAFMAAVLVAMGLACGGWIAESVFYHAVGIRMPDPFSPGSYLIRIGLWALLGGFGVWLGGAMVALATGTGFAGTLWFVSGAFGNVLVQTPIRLRLRRKARRPHLRSRR